MDTESTEKAQKGIQSVEVGSEVLRALTHSAAAMTLKEIAKVTGMSPAKVFPYLVSLVKLQLVQRVEPSGAYAPGALALRLGLYGLQRLNPLREAEAEVLSLASKTGQSVFVTTWGPNGPVVVRQEDPPYPLHLTLRVGTIMSLVNTATGRLFGAYLPESLVRKALDDEGIRLSGAAHLKSADKLQLFKDYEQIREEGMTRTIGNPLPGVNAIAAPVFLFNGTIALAITLVGPTGSFDTRWDGELALTLRQATNNLSYRLGYAAVQDGGA
ncbi:IclR family transcriptional regulator [Trinickia caryophylli]|uniref:Transcriptional regulator, IclR family n=1 Tax=Trinickia caryophylli TaxID=28094 RepID=A0A1X7G2Y6_TRICW|nr:IclR family transcriptional regulator [Trinickia caryophylli]PMS13728.1 IclR family transcriptional regulator [Trinickia caryophylli]TRX14221.1 IclR family transcriptional regulator [Trinickia caryophylli]WQE14047.1 IclR family transcriptional regulator [Trinickia caryophylli]SMF63073.1 transcriptional regulator, IclR family [Trinickia caryophylli]GLU33464.1 transcriptional regulator [Trinickia caryophylli]